MPTTITPIIDLNEIPALIRIRREAIRDALEYMRLHHRDCKDHISRWKNEIRILKDRKRQLMN